MSYLINTGGFLPGPAVPNERLGDYLGTLDHEPEVRAKILKMNGIQSRHYALHPGGEPSHDLYQLGTEAARACLADAPVAPITLLAAGTTNAPLNGPGLASRLHDHLAAAGLLTQSVEISSHAGICTASAQALSHAHRALQSGDHEQALVLGVEAPSAILRAAVFTPPDDREAYDDIRRSQWFMAVFLRTMLSDGAGAFLLSRHPHPQRPSFKIDWIHSSSFAHETPVCMSLDNRTLRLSQDIEILARHLPECTEAALAAAFSAHDDSLAAHDFLLPHLSSFYFRRILDRTLRRFAPECPPQSYTNLAERGNTGAASIFLILDEFHRSHRLLAGQRLLLFIPESGQFNFVIASLRVVTP